MTPPNRVRFRAWVFVRELMIEPDCIHWGGQKVTYGAREFYTDLYPEIESINKEDRCVLMQSTGLLDRNQKEMFEGDVVKDAGYGEGDLEFNDRFVIVFLSMINCVGFTAQRIGGGFCFEDILSAFHKIEIVGNIYEHGELLK